MFDRIRRLGSDTAIYGVSTVLGRFLTFLLTPLYTHVLLPGDLGIVAMIYAYIAVLNVVYGYGMESAYMKYVSTLEQGSKRQVFSVPFFSVSMSGLVFSAALGLFAAPAAEVIGVPAQHTVLIVYAAVILFLDVLALIPFAALRMAHRPKLFASIKLIGIVVNVVTNVLLLFWARMGIAGIFLSNVISSGLVVALLLPTVVSQLEFSRPRGLLRALLAFGLPSVPAGLAAMMIQVINRPILEALRGKEALGVFQANFRLGIFMMLIVSMFDFAWRPFFLSHASDSDARQLFARVLTYFVLLTTGVFLVLSFFLPAVVTAPLFFGHPLIAAPYWDGLPIISVILLAYLFLGVYNNFMAGVYIEKKTRALPPITAAGAVVNITANYALIPPFGLMGAAYATLLSYVAMAVLLFVASQRWYPVPYEWRRIGTIVLSAAAVFVPAQFCGDDPVGLLAKIFLLVLFALLMLGMRFLAPSEREGIAAFFRRGQARPERTDPPQVDPS